MSCAIQLNLVYLCNLGLFASSCVLWPSLTAMNMLWLWLHTKGKHHVCLSQVTDPWSGNAYVNENAKTVQSRHVRDNAIWLFIKYSSYPEGSSTCSMYQRSSGTYTYVCGVWQALFLDSLQGHSEMQYIFALWDAGTVMDSSVTIKAKGVIPYTCTRLLRLPTTAVHLGTAALLRTCVIEMHVFLSSLFVCLYVYISIHCNISFLLYTIVHSQHYEFKILGR